MQLTAHDLVFIDIDMPVSNGIEGALQIREEYPDLPIIIQTVCEDNNNICEAIKAGASGYLLKKHSPINCWSIYAKSLKAAHL